MKKLLVSLFFFSTVFCYGQIIRAKWVQASSELSDAQQKYYVRNIIDGTWKSWAEGSKGNEVGEYFDIEFEDNETIAGFALKNGYGNIDYFAKNNRVKAFKIYVERNYEFVYFETINIKDSVSFEQYAFKERVKCKRIRFVIDDVYRGTMYNDTCIAEIAFLDDVYNEKTFYENILLWIAYGNGESFENYDKNITSVAGPDPEKIMLLDYLPFDLTGGFANREWDEKKQDWIEIKTKIARLNSSSSLKLNGNLPRIDGATAMYPLYSSFVRAVYPEKYPNKNDDVYKFLRDWSYYPNVDLLNSRFTDIYYTAPRELKSIVQCNTTSKAYERLINGETDIIFCYEPSEAEKMSAAAKGKNFNLTPICKDAFVFIVNEKTK